MNIFQKIANLFSGKKEGTLTKKVVSGKKIEGTVKFFNRTKGFGFISYNNGKDEVFVHKSDVKGYIKKNDTVTFEIAKTKKGLAAVNVGKVNK